MLNYPPVLFIFLKLFAHSIKDDQKGIFSIFLLCFCEISLIPLQVHRTVYSTALDVSFSPSPDLVGHPESVSDLSSSYAHYICSASNGSLHCLAQTLSSFLSNNLSLYRDPSLHLFSIRLSTSALFSSISPVNSDLSLLQSLVLAINNLIDHFEDHLEEGE